MKKEPEDVLMEEELAYIIGVEEHDKFRLDICQYSWSAPRGSFMLQ